MVKRAMLRREVGILLVGLMALLPGPCLGERVPPYTIGIIQRDSSPQLDTAREGFLQALKEAGFENRTDFKVDLQNARGHDFSAEMIAQKFHSEQVDLICTLSTTCWWLTPGDAAVIPVMFVCALDPKQVERGEWPLPGRINVTGVWGMVPVDTTLVLIQKVLPRARRLGTLWSPLNRESVYYVKLAKQKARERGMKLITWPVYDPREVVNATRGLLDQGVDALYQVPDPIVSSVFKSLVTLAIGKHIPVFVNQLELIEDGACAAVGQDFFELGYQAGQLVAQVMRGKPPEQIPPQVVKEVKIYLNLKAADEQRVLFPSSILKKADRVIH